MPDRRTITRRAALGLVAGGGLLAASETFGFSNVTADRGVSVSTTDDPNAIIGLTISDPVKKNNQEPLVDIENNTNATISVTVSLDDCSQGTLYDSDESGCSVSLSIDPGLIKTVDIKADVAETIPFTITASSTELSFEATRETTAQTGNVTSAVNVEKVDKFSANANSDDWSIQKVRVTDGDGDDDLDKVEYEIIDSGGTTRATRTDSASGGLYQVTNITIQPDDSSYQVQSGETYTLTVTGYDVDGNTDSATRTDTA